MTAKQFTELMKNNEVGESRAVVSEWEDFIMNQPSSDTDYVTWMLTFAKWFDQVYFEKCTNPFNKTVQ